MTALMYHDLVSNDGEGRSGFPGRDAARYKVTTQQFEEHVRAVTSPTASPQPSTPGPQSPVPIFTFDDGGVSAIDAADTLERHGLVGHFFVTTNYIGAAGFLSANQIRSLHVRGHIVGSHSCSHPLRMGHCRWGQLVDEWRRSRAVLEDIVHAEVRYASVPGGDFAPSVADAAARSGLTTLYTSEPTATVRRVWGLELRGRFTIQRWTSAETVRGLAAGAWIPRARQAVVWNAKKLTKQVGGARYLKLRQLLIGHGDEVRWGDTIMRE